MSNEPAEKNNDTTTRLVLSGVYQTAAPLSGPAVDPFPASSVSTAEGVGRHIPVSISKKKAKKNTLDKTTASIKQTKTKNTTAYWDVFCGSSLASDRVNAEEDDPMENSVLLFPWSRAVHGREEQLSSPSFQRCVVVATRDQSGFVLRVTNHSSIVYIVRYRHLTLYLLLVRVQRFALQTSEAAKKEQIVHTPLLHCCSTFAGPRIALSPVPRYYPVAQAVPTGRSVWCLSSPRRSMRQWVAWQAGREHQILVHQPPPLGFSRPSCTASDGQSDAGVRQASQLEFGPTSVRGTTPPSYGKVTHFRLPAEPSHRGRRGRTPSSPSTSSSSPGCAQQRPSDGAAAERGRRRRHQGSSGRDAHTTPQDAEANPRERRHRPGNAQRRHHRHHRRSADGDGEHRSRRSRAGAQDGATAASAGAPPTPRGGATATPHDGERERGEEWERRAKKERSRRHRHQHQHRDPQQQQQKDDSQRAGSAPPGGRPPQAPRPHNPAAAAGDGGGRRSQRHRRRDGDRNRADRRENRRGEGAARGGGGGAAGPSSRRRRTHSVPERQRRRSHSSSSRSSSESSSLAARRRRARGILTSQELSDHREDAAYTQKKKKKGNFLFRFLRLTPTAQDSTGVVENPPPTPHAASSSALHHRRSKSSGDRDSTAQAATGEQESTAGSVPRGVEGVPHGVVVIHKKKKGLLGKLFSGGKKPDLESFMSVDARPREAETGKPSTSTLLCTAPFPEAAAALLGLLQDYTAQSAELWEALVARGGGGGPLGAMDEDEAAALTAERLWLQRRIRRIQRVFAAVRCAPGGSRRPVADDSWFGGVLPTSATPHTRAPLVQQLGRMAVGSIQGVLQGFTAPPAPSSSALGSKRQRDLEDCHSAARVCRPLARPFSFPLATLMLLQRRTKVANRKTAQGGSPSPAETLPSAVIREPVTRAISRSHREQLVRVFTGRTPCFPELDQAGLLVSPARQVLSQLTVAAEGRLAENAWRLATRSQLLVEWERLTAMVRGWRTDLRQRLGAAADSEAAAHVYVRLVASASGILRLHLQRGLMLDLTYDLWKREWRLLGLQWTLLTHTPSLLDDGAIWVPEPPPSQPLLHRLAPDHRDEMWRHVQQQLASGGLAAGVALANRLLLCVMLDALALQFRELQTNVFVGPLESLLDVEVQPGTYMAYRFRPSPNFLRPEGAAPGPGAERAQATLQARVYLHGGALLVQQHTGTDVTTERIRTIQKCSPSLVLAVQEACEEEAVAAAQRPSVAEEDGLLLDAEQLLWNSLQTQGPMKREAKSVEGRRHHTDSQDTKTRFALSRGAASFVSTSPFVRLSLFVIIIICIFFSPLPSHICCYCLLFYLVFFLPTLNYCYYFFVHDALPQQYIIILIPSFASMTLPGEPKDKYEAILAKFDWHSPRPPRGYQAGVGRGAKPVVTTAELRVGVGFGPQPSSGHRAPTEEDRLLDDLDAMEEARVTRKKTRRLDPSELHLPETATAGQSGAAGPARRSGSGAKTKAKLSLQDLATVEIASVAKADAGLTVREARDETAEAAELYAFGDEDGITANEVQRAVEMEREGGVAAVLSMGSPDEQSTYITHSRVYRDNGQHRLAARTLREGCQRTGSKGTAIWLECLAFIGDGDASYTARRRLLEEATAACPGEDSLWLQLLPLVPPQELLERTQRAVLACPHSERLWLRLLALTPRPEDQKKQVKAALKQVPQLPSLWGRLARLEGVATGKQLFHAAAKRHPSLGLVVEAAKFAEWCILQPEPAPAPAPAACSSPLLALEEKTRHGLAEVEGIIGTAAAAYLQRSSEEDIRVQWLQLALDAAEDQQMPLGKESCPESAASLPCGYGWTASYMIAAFVCPDLLRSPPPLSLGPSLQRLLASAWIEDVVVALPGRFRTPSAPLQWALLGAWWVMREHLQRVMPTAVHSDAPVDLLSLVRTVFSQLPEGRCLSQLDALVEELYRSQYGDTVAPTQQVKQEPLTEVQALMDLVMRHGDPAPGALESRLPPSAPEHFTPPFSLAWAPSAMKKEAGATDADSFSPASSFASEYFVSAGSCAAPARPLPHVVSIVLLMLSRRSALLQNTGNGTAAALPAHPHVVLMIAKALYQRHRLSAALGCLCAGFYLHCRLPPTEEEEEEAAGFRFTAGLRYLTAMGKTYAALGQLETAELVLHSAAAWQPPASVPGAVLQHEGLMELPWVKLGILRRSTGQDVVPLLEDALQRHPHSERLWLMRLEAEGRRFAAAVAAAPEEAGSPTWQMEAAAAVRRLAHIALQGEHCGHSVRVWAYVAHRLDAEVLHDVAAGRARLLEAANRCAGGPLSARSGRNRHRNTSSPSLSSSAVVSPEEMMHMVLATAAAEVERSHTGRAAAAWEVTQEALQALPKSAQEGGALLLPDPAAAGAAAAAAKADPAAAASLASYALQALGHLLALYIDLAPAASRGAAAVKVLSRYKVHHPFVLLATARVYHLGGAANPLLRKAARQALKALELSRGRCGDATALLWEMCDHPAYQEVARELVQEHITALALDTANPRQKNTAPAGVEEEKVVEDSSPAPPPLSPECIRWFVFSTTAFFQGHPNFYPHGATAAVKALAATVKQQEEEDSKEGSIAAYDLPQLPNSGPHWIHVSKVEDPRNVTLLGFRDGVEAMLRRVRRRLALSEASKHKQRKGLHSPVFGQSSTEKWNRRTFSAVSSLIALMLLLLFISLTFFCRFPFSLHACMQLDYYYSLDSPSLCAASHPLFGLLLLQYTSVLDPPPSSTAPAMASPAEEEILSDNEWEVPIADDALGPAEVDPETQQQIALQTAAHVMDDEAEKELAGDEVLVRFALPDGRTAEGRFFMGQTIEVLKMFLDKAFGLAYETSTLYLGETYLMDPLSLVDLPFVPKTTNDVKVVVQA
eukprot:gene1554-939_t